ncbi:dr1-associated corepressor-like [Uloborus diversus]|uniref:dr1-associated corepressor-like n=1 Tax=Uloborus diversus TaxID=327109 RepID=UPI00240A14DA|nr:dr1-associated corepressor-like [Uloborus diversus]
MPSKKKKYNARFPPARIKKIMQTDEEIGKVAAAVPVIISRALELFVESLVTKASLITKSRNAKTLTPSHLKSCVLADSNLEFLRELVSSIPDVQGEDEQGNACLLDGNLSGGEMRDTQSVRQRRPKDRGNSEDSAGPSHSTADESETWSAEEDGEEDSEDSTKNCSSHLPIVSSLPPATIPPVSCNIAFASNSSHHYMPHPVQCISSSSAVSADDDYDS